MCVYVKEDKQKLKFCLWTQRNYNLLSLGIKKNK